MKDSVRKKIQEFASSKQSAEEIEMFHRWFVDYQDIDDKEDALYDLWNETVSPADDSVYKELYKFLKTVEPVEAKTPVTVEKEPTKRVYINPWIFKIAAVLLVTLLSSYFIKNVFFDTPQTHLKELVASYGKIEEIALSDGTVVKINSGSVLLYPEEFEGKNRVVHLVGEGVFDVEKNADHPFVVKSNMQELKVLGTKFNISAYPESEEITVTLIEGKVEVYYMDQAQKYILAPNEQLVFSKVSSQVTIQKVDAEKALSWTRGQLQLRNVGIDEMLLAMEKRYDVSFQYNANHVSKDKFNITFRSETDLDGALSIINYLVGPMSYDIDNNICKLTFKTK